MNRKKYQINSKKYNTYSQYLTKSMNNRCWLVKLPAITDVHNQKEAEEAQQKQLFGFVHAMNIQRAIDYGQCGWALFDDYVPQKILRPLKKIQDDGEYSQDIDEQISYRCSDKDIRNLIKEIQTYNESEDFYIKIKQAENEFKHKRYYICALLLFNIIDSHNISLLNNKQQDPTKQGNKALLKLVSLQYSSIINGLSPCESEQKEKQLHELMAQYTYTENYEADARIYELINLLWAFNTIFSNDKWEQCTELPSCINRHFLIHGIYQNQDIMRYDCIKLFFLLRKLVRVIPKAQ